MLPLVFSSLLAGCGEQSTASAQQGGAPPAQVRALTVQLADLPLHFEYAAQVTGSRDVEVHAQVGGILLERTYREGAPVKKGDVLFRIDPDTASASDAQARGELRRLRAALEQALVDRDRTLALFAKDVISAQERDNAVTTWEQAKAAVEAAEAAARETTITLNRTEVRAPISGITSREYLSEGSLISVSGNSLLTVITQTDPIYVNFSTPGQEVLRNKRLIAEGRMIMPEGGPTVRLRLSDGREYAHTGTIDFGDSRENPQTGTVDFRAVFPNPEGLVLPGSYVRAELEGVKLTNVLLVPQRAVMFTKDAPLVYVLDAEGTATPRPVVLGRSADGFFVIESGLTPGDRIVAEGVIKVRPGAKVTVIDDGGQTAEAKNEAHS